MDNQELKLVVFQEPNNKYSAYYFLNNKLQRQKLSFEMKKNQTLDKQEILKMFPNLKDFEVIIHNY